MTRNIDKISFPYRASTHLNLLHVIAESRSEEHTSELQSLRHLVCRLLLEKKKKKNNKKHIQKEKQNNKHINPKPVGNKNRDILHTKRQHGTKTVQQLTIVAPRLRTQKKAQ